jgi:hypothetical protein
MGMLSDTDRALGTSSFVRDEFRKLGEKKL